MVLGGPFDLFAILDDENLIGPDSDDELLEALPQPRVRRTNALFSAVDREASVFWRRYIQPALNKPDAEIRDEGSREGGVFRSRFRVPYAIFEMIVEDIKEVHGLPDFKRDATGQMGVHIKLLVLGSLRFITSGCPFDLIQELTNVGLETHRKFLHEKFATWGEVAARRHIRMPRDADSLNKVQAPYEACGLPGAVGSIDCVHLIWDACPAGHRSACAGKDKVPTLVFEVVGSHSKRILSVSQYFWGTFNDRTVSRLDPVFDLFRDDGEFLKGVRWHSFRFDGSLREHQGAYLICDGGYNDWRCLTCPYKVSLRSCLLVMVFVCCLGGLL